MATEEQGDLLITLGVMQPAYPAQLDFVSGVCMLKDGNRKANVEQERVELITRWI